MRPTAVVASGPPSGPTYLGWWGDMGGPKQKGITQYAMSPYRQAPLRGMFSGYLFNGYRRIWVQAPYFAIPFVMGYSIYSWGKSDYAFRNSKAGHLAHAEH